MASYMVPNCNNAIFSRQHYEAMIGKLANMGSTFLWNVGILRKVVPLCKMHDKLKKMSSFLWEQFFVCLFVCFFVFFCVCVCVGCVCVCTCVFVFVFVLCGFFFFFSALILKCYCISTCGLAAWSASGTKFG